MSSSNQGISALLPPGLGKKRHLEEAQTLEDPFKLNLVQDHDLMFAAESQAILGHIYPSWLDYQLEVLEPIHADLQPLEQELNRTPARVCCPCCVSIPGLLFVLLLFKHSMARQVTTFWLHQWFQNPGTPRINRCFSANTFHGTSAFVWVLWAQHHQ